ncbi:Hypothetical predicted protein [Scomber scombrus]|uniref:Uncharacterized protein n=1 Tax=Scomber scombrus TaxID=13677 RepID=A0AAV1P1I6_SCOSC
MLGTPLVSTTGPNQPDPTRLSPLALKRKATPRLLPALPLADPHLQENGRWRGVAAETSAGQTIGALCRPLELTGLELRYCAQCYTHADEACRRRDTAEAFFLLQGTADDRL